MKKSNALWPLILLSVSTYGETAPVLSRDMQLEALSVRNQNAGNVAKQNVAYLDELCGQRSDAQVRQYLQSDYQHILVALQHALNPISFAQLRQASIGKADCDTLEPSLNYLIDTLGIQKSQP